MLTHPEALKPPTIKEGHRAYIAEPMDPSRGDSPLLVGAVQVERFVDVEARDENGEVVDLKPSAIVSSSKPTGKATKKEIMPLTSLFSTTELRHILATDPKGPGLTRSVGLQSALPFFHYNKQVAESLARAELRLVLDQIPTIPDSERIPSPPSPISFS